MSEYWAIDPDDAREPGRVRAWALRDGRFRESAALGDAVASESLPGLVLALAPIRALAARREPAASYREPE